MFIIHRCCVLYCWFLFLKMFIMLFFVSKLAVVKSFSTMLHPRQLPGGSQHRSVDLRVKRSGKFSQCLSGFRFCPFLLWFRLLVF